MNIGVMAIHIGSIIKALVKQRGMGVTEFARRINYTRRNVYEIFNRETIDTGLLLKINEVLNENLFLYYTQDDSTDPVKEIERITAALTKEIEKIKSSK